MPDEFKYDVFLSHSAKDKAAVRPVAECTSRAGMLEARGVAPAPEFDWHSSSET